MAKFSKKQDPGHLRLVIPFFLVLGLMTVISFCIPLRPQRSMLEKRNLQKFPEFSWEALASGSYFDDITLWFSDTFPGRETWIQLAADINSLHGTSDITIQGDLPEMETVPPIPDGPTEPEAMGETTEATEETLPEETHWGGVDAHDAEIQLGAVIQIGDTAFNYQGFNKLESDHYAKAVTGLSQALEGQNIRVVSAPAPTSVGIMVEEDYLEQMKCASQDAIISYMHSQMGPSVIPVDTYHALVPHNDEYIYFRTDHHWTALGAYYSYRAICEALDMTPAELSAFEPWDQGEFRGSLTFKSARPNKLRTDNVVAYIPQGDITMTVFSNEGKGTERPLLQDMTKREIDTKYLTFIWSDNPLTEIVNASLPDGPTCIIVKDSFGNCLVPFFTQNYHKIYVVDYRKFTRTGLSSLAGEVGADDVIFTPYVTATQSILGTKLIKQQCR